MEQRFSTVGRKPQASNERQLPKRQGIFPLLAFVLEVE